MDKQPYVGGMALCITIKKKLLKSGEIRDFYQFRYGNEARLHNLFSLYRMSSMCREIVRLPFFRGSCFSEKYSHRNFFHQKDTSQTMLAVANAIRNVIVFVSALCKCNCNSVTVSVTECTYMYM